MQKLIPFNTTKTIPVHWNISELAFRQEKKKIIKNVVKTIRETFPKCLYLQQSLFLEA